MLYKFLLLFALVALITFCESSIKADYHTLKAKKIILVADDGAQYLLKLATDDNGEAIIKPVRLRK